MHKLLVHALLAFVFVFLSLTSFSQTAGLIYKTAGTGAATLDPNGDGYSSSTTSGFSTNDETQSEIPYKPLVVPSTEPTSDPGPGPNCGFTDLVDSGVEDPVLTYFDGSSNLLFRFRLGSTADNSKGYSILIDSDQKFGFSGSNADPNAVNGNPGFEIEIVMESNFGVYIYSVDGTTTPVLKNGGSPLSYANYVQKSVALTTNCGDPDYFYDFYVPFSLITTYFPSVTTSTPLRMVAVTSMNPAPAIGNNAVSDVGGIDDQAYGYSYDNIFETIINNFYPTPVTGIDSGFPPDRSSCPSITSSVTTSATSISGTSSEASGTTIKVYKNGSLLGTTTTSGSSWTLSPVSGLVSGDIITASATASGESESVTNCTTITVSASCSANPTGVTGTVNKNIQGSGVIGATIKVYSAGVQISANPTASATVDATGAFCWKSNGQSSCNAGSSGNTPNAGYYKVTQTESGKCESSGTYICIGTTTASSTPVITTSTILTTTSSISGTSTGSAYIFLYADGSEIGTTTAAAGGSWTISVSGLTFGASITAKAVESGSCISNASTAKTVMSITATPSIYGTYCTATTISSITGTTTEASGTTIDVFANGVSVGTTTSNASGSWTKSGLSLASGTSVTAKATATSKTISAASAAVVIGSQTSNAGLAVNSPITEGQTTISGTVTGSGTVTVYIDGFSLGNASVTGSTWSLTGITSTNVYAGGAVTATITQGGNCESNNTTAVVVSCTAPSASLTVTPSTASVCSGGTTSVTVNSAESNIVYQLYNGASTTGSSALGANANLILTSGALTSNANLTVKALKISPVSCTTTLTNTQSVTVTAVIASNTLTAPSTTTFCGTGDPDIITGSTPTGGSGTYAYQWQSSANGTTYNNISGATSKDYNPGIINATVYYKRIVTSGACSNTSAAVTMTVQPTDLTNTLTAPATITFCNSGDAAQITGSTPTGGTGTYTYQWQSSTDNSTYNDISLATSKDYNPPSVSSSTFYRRLVSSGTCTNFPSGSVKISIATIANTTITSNTASITANGTSTATITIQLKDAQGNLSAGACVPVLSTTKGTLSSVTDNANGTYTATLTSSTTSGTATITGTLGGSSISDNEVVTFVAGPISAATSTITAASSSITANGTSTTVITVQGKDANGNNLTAGGATVTLSTTLGTLSAVTDNGNGTYTATLTSSSSSGTATVTGTINGTGITDNETVTFITTAADPTTSTITASSNSIAANGTSTTLITVQAKNSSGVNLNVGGASILLSTTLGTLSAVTDNGNGTYTATLTSSTTAGTATITGQMNGSAMTDNEIVSFTPGAASTATTQITASPSSIVANGTSTSIITIQVKDINGNNLTIGGAIITLATTAGSIGSITDNNNGTYTAILTSSTTAGTATVTGKINGSDITDNETVTFSPGAASTATSLITASPASITADGVSTSTITVQAKDANGNNLTTGGATIALSTTTGTVSSVTDNNNGTYTATVTSGVVTGTATITGTLNGSAITDNATIVFTPGAAATATTLITASPISITANGTSTSTITIQTKDTNGNNLTSGGATIVLSTTLGSIGSVTDNSNGTYTATLTSSTLAGTATVTGTLNGSSITDNATVDFTVGAASTTASLITASPSSITADGTTTSTIAVQLKDVNGNNLTTGGALVTLATTSGSIGGVTDHGDGTYTATLTSSTIAGTATITGKISGTSIADNEIVIFAPGAASTTTSLITASPSSITADGITTSTITVQLNDANGNNLTTGGATVTLTTTSGSIGSITDNGNGTYTATLTSSTTAGTATITGKINGTSITDNETVAFVPGAASTATSLITASSSSIIANGTSTSTITVQLKDANGNNVTTGGATITLTTTLGSIGSITDNGNSTYTATLTSSTTAGTAIITGKLNGSDFADNASVSFMPGPADETTTQISASPNVITADGTSTSTILVQVKDSNGNNLATGGATITLAATKGSLGSVTDNGDGTYSAILTSAVATGTATITGTLNSNPIADNATVKFVTDAASAAQSTITVASSTLVANGSTTTTITVQLKDSNGNNITTGGDVVTISATLGTVSVVTDNGDGTYSATLTSPLTTGTATLTASVNGAALTGNKTVAFIPGPASAATTLLAATPTTIIADGITTSTITIQTKDANGNDLTAGGASIVLSTTKGSIGTTTDNNDGSYTATLTSSTIVGIADITGTLNGTAIVDHETVSFIAGIASAATTTIMASSGSITADGITTSLITIQAKDANGNNLTTGGALVTLSTTLGTITAITDNGDGTYSATVTSSVTTGTATITGKINSAGISDNEIVTFIPGIANASQSTITASPHIIAADGASTSSITVRAKDTNGNNLTTGGDNITLSTTSGALSSVVDNGDGTYSATLTSSTLTGTATVTGTLNTQSITDTETVTFTSSVASAATSVITTSSTTLTADGTSVTTVTIQLKDANGNLITTGGYNVALSTTAGTLTSVTDNGDGTYTATLTAPASTGVAIIKGTLEGASIADDAVVNFVPGPASGATSLITALATSMAADGTSTTTITIQLKDSNGNLITTGGDNVSLSTTLGTLSSVVDNGDGTYTVTLTSAVTTGIATITGSVNGNPISDNATVNFTALSVTSSIALSKNSIPADGASTVTIIISVKDTNSQPVSGATVLVNTTGGTLSNVTDNNDGTYTLTLTSSENPGTVTITWSVNGNLSSTSATVKFDSVFFIPEGFSPDGDGVNDVFAIEGSDQYKISLRIYNRWGNLVYEALEYKNDWDGIATHGIVIGEKLPDGTYFYAIDLNNGEKPLVRYMTIKRK